MVLYSAAIIDFKHLILPDALVFTVLWGGLLLAASGYSMVRVKDAVYGVAAAWLLLWAVMKLWETLCKRDGLGYGDVKLYAACGGMAWLAAPAGITLLFGAGRAAVLRLRAVLLYARG